MMIFIFSMVMALAAPVKAAESKPVWSFSFGTHLMETIELSERSLNGKVAIVGTYRIGEHIHRRRVLPQAVADEVKHELKAIFDENKKDIPLMSGLPCAGRMIWSHGGRESVYCVGRSSTLAQRRLSEWIRKVQGYLDVQPLK